MDLKNTALKILLGRARDVERCFIPAIDFAEDDTGGVVVPFISTLSPRKAVGVSNSVLNMRMNSRVIVFPISTTG